MEDGQSPVQESKDAPTNGPDAGKRPANTREDVQSSVREVVVIKCSLLLLIRKKYMSLNLLNLFIFKFKLHSFSFVFIVVLVENGNSFSKTNL